MERFLRAAVVVVLAAGAARADADKAPDLTKNVDLGPLADDFEVVAAGQAASPLVPGEFWVTLRPRRDVDTGAVRARVGFFSAAGEIEDAAPLVFAVEFPLRKGESVRAATPADRPLRLRGDVARIAVRPAAAGPKK